MFTHYCSSFLSQFLFLFETRMRFARHIPFVRLKNKLIFLILKDIEHFSNLLCVINYLSVRIIMNKYDYFLFEYGECADFFLKYVVFRLYF